MPTYSYACTECDHRFDAVQSFSDDSLTVCPECSGRLRKVFSAVGVVFKGSGFYRTDSRNGSTSSVPAAKGDSAGSSSNGSSGNESSGKESASTGSSTKGSSTNGSSGNGSSSKDSASNGSSSRKPSAASSSSSGSGRRKAADGSAA